ncbi:MAG: RNA polymerase sigma factor [Phycisphaerales bacterium]|nr:RNA polymerase sigma factor [Phycisphaerales bacterium]
MEPADAACIASCLSGEKGAAEAYRTLVERYQKPLMALIRGKGTGQESADEILQETFVRGYVNLARLGKHDAFFPWLVGIATRVAQEMLRNEARQRDIARQSLWVNPRMSDSNGPMPDLELEKAVAELAEPYREVVLLRYYGSLSCSEVADRLDMPLGSVTKTLSRAYGMLREQLSMAMKERAV